MQLPDEKHRLEFPSLPGVYGFVTVGGQPLEVYGVEVKDGKTIAYIEAKEGKQFEVLAGDVRSYNEVDDDFVIDVVIDGHTVNGSHGEISEEIYQSPLDDPVRFFLWAGKATPTTILPFLFTKLLTTDDDDTACTDEKVIRGLGSITLKYCRVRALQTQPSAPDFSARGNNQPIHEDSKKANLSHCASFGEPVEHDISGAGVVNCDWIDPEDSPLTVLEFRYRSRDLLHLEGHLPSSPEPSPPLAPPAQPAILGTPSPAPSASVSPAVAGPSHHRGSSPSTTTFRASGSPSSADISRLSQLEAELAELQRDKRIAALQREIDQLRGGASSSSATSTATAAKRIKPEPGTLSESERKRVKREEVDEVERQKEEDKRKGKRAEVIDLCDSD